MSNTPRVAGPTARVRRLRPALPDALAVALVGLALLALWELASWAYLGASVPPEVPEPSDTLQTTDLTSRRPMMTRPAT